MTPSIAPARPPAARPAPAARLRWEGALFYLLLVVHLVPIWAFRYFPTQDGASHVNNANVLVEYGDAANTLFRQYYTLNFWPEPNLSGHLLLVLGQMLSNPLVGEKLLLSVYVLALPLAVRYALAAFRTDATFLALLSFPMVYGYALHMGFYNFSLSLPLFFAVLGYWARHRERFGPRETGVLMVLFMALYLSHLLTVVMAFLAMGFLTLWQGVLELRAHPAGRADLLRRLARARVLGPLVAAVPVLVLVVHYSHRQADAPVDMSIDAPWVVRVRRLTFFEGLVSHAKLEVAGSALLAATLVALAGYVLWRRRREGTPLGAWDGLLGVTAGYVVAYFLAPESALGGGLIWPRMTLYVYFALLLWLGAQRFPARLRPAVAATAVAISASMLALRMERYAELNRYYAEFLSVEPHLRPNRTLLPLNFLNSTNPAALRFSWRTEPFRHLAGYLAARRDLVTLDNYEGRHSFFPVRFRPELNPYAVMPNHEQPDQHFVPLLEYGRRTRGTVDYVLVWGGRAEMANPRARFVYRQLDSAYERVYQSGRVELYRRRGLAP